MRTTCQRCRAPVVLGPASVPLIRRRELDASDGKPHRCKQPGLFDTAQADRSEGLDRAGRGRTSADWRASAAVHLTNYLRAHAEMFVDDWWAWAQERGLEEPPEARALGPVFLAAAREGYMEKTTRLRSSVRSHLGPKPIWRSRIYRPACREEEQ